MALIQWKWWLIWPYQSGWWWFCEKGHQKEGALKCLFKFFCQSSSNFLSFSIIPWLLLQPLVPHLIVLDIDVQLFLQKWVPSTPGQVFCCSSVIFFLSGCGISFFSVSFDSSSCLYIQALVLPMHFPFSCSLFPFLSFRFCSSAFHEEGTFFPLQLSSQMVPRSFPEMYFPATPFPFRMRQGGKAQRLL